MIYLGADPGVSGALAVIEDGEVSIHDLPTTEIETSKKSKSGKKIKKSQLDPHAAALMFEVYAGQDCYLVIEKEQPMPSFERDANGQPKPRRAMGVVSTA